MFLSRLLKPARQAALLLRYAGPRVFVQQVWAQLYGIGHHVRFEKNLEDKAEPIAARIPYVLRPATDADMEEMVADLASQGKDSVRELLHRKKFWDSGFRCCYVARTADTGELCHVKWFITSEYNGLLRHDSRLLADHLNDDEVLTEYTFTFEKFRGTRIGAAVRCDLSEMMRKRGYKRIIGYASLDNPASLKSFEIDGYRRLELVDELRVLNFARRKRAPVDSPPAAEHQGLQ